MKNLLWLDDQSKECEMLAKSLRDNDFDVSLFETADKALDEIKNITFDIFLVDIRLPGSSMNGIEFIKKAYKIAPKAKFAILSSFLYRSQFLEEIRSLNNQPKILEIEKSSFSYDDEFGGYEQTIKKIIDLSEKNIEEVIEIYTSDIDINTVDPFTVTLEEYDAMSAQQKDQLSIRAYKHAKEVLERAWAENNEWVLLCGNKDLDYTTKTRDQKLTEEQIFKISKIQNAVPFEFVRAIQSEDRSWKPCGHNNGTQWYPSVTFKVNEKNGTHYFLNIHFDTGTYESLLSYEEFRDKGLIPPGQRRITMSRAGSNDDPLVCFEVSKFLKMVGQISEQTAAVKIEGYAIKDWETTTWAKFCDNKCKRYVTAKEKRLCPERIGLIGRSLLTSNGLKIILDGETKCSDIAS